MLQNDNANVAWKQRPDWKTPPRLSDVASRITAAMVIHGVYNLTIICSQHYLLRL